MGIKDFFIKQALKAKLKDVPEDKREILSALMEQNPELFKKIGDEIKRRKKDGQREHAASLGGMRGF